MFKSLSGARITGTDKNPILEMWGSTWRGTGTEFVRSETALRPLLLEMARDGDLRPMLLQALLDADEAVKEARRGSVEAYEIDSEFLEEWLDTLEPDELYVVLHKFALGGVRRRYWFYGLDFDHSDACNRAMSKLPKGVGPARLAQVVERYRNNLADLTSEP